MLCEWHGLADSVTPVGHDVHRTCRAALLADEAPTDHRARLVLGQGVQADIDHAPIATALDVAGYVTVREPFCRAARWVFARPSCVLSLRSHHG